jgi:hypothetical protein
MEYEPWKSHEAELTLPELVELKRHAVQVLIDTFEETDVDARPCYQAREKMDALYETAKQGQITEETVG